LSEIRTLIIAPQWIGDAVMTQPLLSALKRQGHEITVAALPWVAPVYEAMAECQSMLVLPFSRGLLEFTKRRDWAKSIKGQFDQAYVCPNTLKSALLPYLADIPLRVGYSGEMRWGLLNRRLPNPGKHVRGSMVMFYLALAQGTESEGLSAPMHAPQPTLKIDAQTCQASLDLFDLTLQNYVALAPGAEYGDAKRWPKEKFCELIASIDQTVVLLGAPSDQALGEEIVQGVAALGASNVQNLCGQTNLKQALSLIACSTGLVSNDSGLMHVAAALGVPQVALFGSSSPEHTPALSSQAQMIWLKWDAAYQPPLACAPCYQRVCPLGHKRCLVDISAQRVRHHMQGWQALKV
jgi:heptosyltransferase-2